MTIANVEMAEAWDGPEGDHWTEQADRYESIGPEYWNRLAQAIDIQVDDHVLDVGCGTGRSTREAARIATSGSAVGVDLSRRMLERAREIARAEGLTNVRFERADAQVHPFPAAAFDVVVSSFGAMFFADAAAAFTNLARSMRPRGRLGVLAWQELEANEWLCEIRAALAAGRDLPTPQPGNARSVRARRPATRQRRSGAGGSSSMSPSNPSTRRCGSAPTSPTRSRSSRPSAWSAACCTISTRTRPRTVSTRCDRPLLTTKRPMVSRSPAVHGSSPRARHAAVSFGSDFAQPTSVST